MDKYQDLCARVENIITNKGYRVSFTNGTG